MLKKIIAPVVIVILIAAYYIGFAVFLIRDPEVPLLLKALMAVIAIALTGVGIHVLKLRADEIRSGVEDDLDKY
jgi:predicted membrane channel-forming protein YqfA (hemolysin III family)